MNCRYNGKILHVDLSGGKVSVKEPPEEIYGKYMGGSALNLHYFSKNFGRGVILLDLKTYSHLAWRLQREHPFRDRAG